MASRYALGQALQLLWLSSPCPSTCALSLQATRLISASTSRLWPDVIVPSMGESIKEGSIAAVLKQVGQPVQEDEVIAQIETDKVTIDIKAPAKGFLQRLHVKPADVVVAGQVVAVVGVEAPAGAATGSGAAASTTAAAATPATTISGRKSHIHFPPRVTASGTRLSDLSEAEYTAAVAAAEAGGPVKPGPATSDPPPSPPAAPQYPVPAAKAAPPPVTKNKLQYITRPDGRGGPPRRPLTERELDMINMGGVY
ncbi:2-oxoglutarate dehydrogenase, E2 component [Volvox carteri f. nagariensis]|uniref:2-oxoglutarate dehydrogenase, E2 component n=1 Tax=Volvox carteri f. nagariensis TaxID=3068 RepID=D8TJZ0_VOLCA|nr:2-oxoglutarate dehydrogenase, E2 component [Volvox carteri f. nagariensis]EFJ52155.1 2-oxoglutarate dehydrogenase, E2 component [Volvox carteri f. nagariensis]|eukprot:XP_002946929.1 2-oxoglutarate dehydrogenase, E2 component [Volvox carteri f. nagariensis]